MIKKILVSFYLTLILVILALVFGCQSVPGVAFVVPVMTIPPQEPVVADVKATPPPQRTPAPTIPPLEIPVSIREIKLNDSGTVIRLYLYGTKNHPQLKVGMIGNVYNDGAKTEHLGRIKLVKVTDSVSEATVETIKSTPNRRTAVVVFLIPQ